MRGHRATTRASGLDDHLLGLSAHHAVRSGHQRRWRPSEREHHTRRGRRPRPRIGLCRGVGHQLDRPVRQSSVPDGRRRSPTRLLTSVAVPDAVIDPPFRGERVGGLPISSSSSTRSPSFSRTGGCDAASVGHRAELTITSPRPPSRRWPARLRAARDIIDGHRGVASTKASSSERVAPGRGRRLRRGQPGEHRPGADARRCDWSRATRRRCVAPTRSSCQALVLPDRRWPGLMRARPVGTRSGPGRPTRRPYLGIRLGLQLLFEGQRRGPARRRSTSRPANVRLIRAPTCRRSAGTRSKRSRPHPLFDGIEGRAEFTFVTSMLGDRFRCGELFLATDRHGAPFVSVIAATPSSASSSTRETSGVDGPRLANFVDLVPAA